MASTRAAAKRASLPLQSDYTSEFIKDWERLKHSGRHDLRQIKGVMLLLISNSGPLPPEWKDHELTGEWRDHRECHVAGDLLLIYRVSGMGVTAIIFVRANTHSELFD